MSVTCLINGETMIPAEHPIRPIKRLLGEVLAKLDRRFAAMYAANGRPSIPPERLLLAKVLMALYSIRSERQFCERLHRTHAAAQYVVAAYNLVRLARLSLGPPTLARA